MSREGQEEEDDVAGHRGGDEEEGGGAPLLDLGHQSPINSTLATTRKEEEEVQRHGRRARRRRHQWMEEKGTPTRMDEDVLVDGRGRAADEAGGGCAQWAGKARVAPRAQPPGQARTARIEGIGQHGWRGLGLSELVIFFHCASPSYSTYMLRDGRRGIIGGRSSPGIRSFEEFCLLFSFSL